MGNPKPELNLDDIYYASAIKFELEKMIPELGKLQERDEKIAKELKHAVSEIESCVTAISVDHEKELCLDEIRGHLKHIHYLAKILDY